MEKEMEELIKLMRKDTPDTMKQAMVLSFAMGLDAKSAKSEKKEATA